MSARRTVAVVHDAVALDDDVAGDIDCARRTALRERVDLALWRIVEERMIGR